MWKTIDKENTPPPERPRPRPITPPADHERRTLFVENVHSYRTVFLSEKKTSLFCLGRKQFITTDFCR